MTGRLIYFQEGEDNVTNNKTEQECDRFKFD